MRRAEDGSRDKTRGREGERKANREERMIGGSRRSEKIISKITEVGHVKLKLHAE